MQGRHILWAVFFVGVGAVLALGQPAQPGGGGGPGGRGPGFGPPSTYDQMTRVLTDLTDDQKAKLKKEGDAMQQELQDMQQDMRDAMDTLRGGGGDAAARQKAMETMQKLNTQRDTAMAAHEANMREVLTPEQVAKWETFKLKQQVDQRLMPLGLTDDQKTKVAAMVEETGAKLGTLKDPKEIAATLTGFWKKVINDILTETQIPRLFTGGGRGGPGFGPGGPGGPGGSGGPRGPGGGGGAGQ